MVQNSLDHSSEKLMLMVRLTVVLVAVIPNITTDNIAVRAGLYLQSERRSYVS